MPTGSYKRLAPDLLKQRLEEIAVYQAAPIKQKIATARAIIQQAASKQSGPVVVMFSGGRDSATLALLARDLNPELLYNDTGLASPAATARVKTIADILGMPLTVTHPDRPAFEMWQALGHYPIGPKRGHTYWKQDHPALLSSPVQCCYHLKERPARGAIRKLKAACLLWGTRAADSNRRKMAVADHGLIQPPALHWPCWQAQPLAFWRDQDVAEFLTEHMPGMEWEHRGESGCRCCCTDIARADNQITRLFLDDRQGWEVAMRSGLGQQILNAQGIADNLETILSTQPERLLRVRR